MVDLNAKNWFEQLQADPEWAARNAAHEAKMEDRGRRLTANERPIVQDLRRAGFAVDSVFDLVNTREPYPEAVPVLLAHLKRGEQYESTIRDGIARALTVWEARHAVPELIAAFRRDPDTSVTGPKSGLANAIDALAEEEHFDEIASLAVDETHGAGRALLVEWLGKRSIHKVKEILKKLKADPHIEVAGRAKKALKGDYRKRC